ncbi:MAG: hypothetical protein P4M07_19025 [Xanthobacteraceae bacterium]|nr:hypothetical protein [Xanthobacteraceae bacterium]
MVAIPGVSKTEQGTNAWQTLWILWILLHFGAGQISLDLFASLRTIVGHRSENTSRLIE